MILKAENNLELSEETAAAVVPVQATPYVDRSEVLLQQMTFIAFNNKSFLNLK